MPPLILTIVIVLAIIGLVLYRDFKREHTANEKVDRTHIDNRVRKEKVVSLANSYKRPLDLRQSIFRD